MYHSSIDAPVSNRPAPLQVSRAGRLGALLASSQLGAWVQGLILTAALVVGWLTRHMGAINPEHGVGYALGITGGSMMLLLLVYPLRKRMGLRARWGSIAFWFRLHMLLGLIGPLLILYHARFSWGALNSAVAVTAMLIVAGSGLIGRFFYTRVHRGYSGRKLQVQAVTRILRAELRSLADEGAVGTLLFDRLEPFEKVAAHAGSSFGASARAVVTIGFATRVAQRQLKRDLRSMLEPINLPPMELRGRHRELLRRTNAYFHAVRRAAQFAFYDRMLRLWHLLHLPLFVMLIFSAVLHVFAVHMY